MTPWLGWVCSFAVCSWLNLRIILCFNRAGIHMLLTLGFCVLVNLAVTELFVLVNFAVADLFMRWREWR